MKKWFYERADEFLESPANKTFEEVLWMTDAEFEAWVDLYCTIIADIWDNKGQPPRVGLSEREIKEQFKKIETFFQNTDIQFLQKEKGSDKPLCIRNTSIIGNAANQWFPTMMKTKINYTSNVKGGLSIYDHFKDKSLREKMVKYGRRHFKRDSFYHYSNPLRILKDDTDRAKFAAMFKFPANSAREWIEEFEKNHRDKGWDYWIQPIRNDDAEYTGYSSDMKNVSWHILTKKEIEELGALIPDKCKTVMNDFGDDVENFYVRPFRLGQRIFPIGIKAFRVSVCQYAVNFPPLTAKFLYERYLSGKDKAIIWDPSAGFGGRLLGAMSVHQDRVKELHYIGTDPNTDHNTTLGRTKYHELADFYNKVKNENILAFEAHEHTYEIYQCGSEVMKDKPEFQKYKGKLDLVFTSPPYFAKEVYSDDVEQSAIKFDQFDSWVQGFLKPTLETACEWLKPGGYLLWNIADAKFGSELLPLEEVSRQIIRDCGLEEVETLKMILAQMPGGNRTQKIVNDAGELIEEGLAKNVCKMEEAGKKGVGRKVMWFKFEPIFVFKKP